MSKKYQILRINKLKNSGKQTIKGSANHAFREIKTPNANASLTKNNIISGSQNSQDLVNSINRIIEKAQNRRIDNVLCLEYLITASPEFFEKRTGKSYFANALTFLEKKHGKENVVCSVIHLDETTPHMTAYVVPMKDGVLNAKAFTGGRKNLSLIQDTFHSEVAKKYKLERGLKGSKAKHTSISTFYARTKLKTPTVPTRTSLFLMSDDERMETMKTLQAQAVNAICANEKLEDEREIFALKIQKLESQRDEFKKEMELQKAMNKRIALHLKSAYTRSEFSKELGVEIVGKADIFDVLQRQNLSMTFDQAVAFVLAKMPIKNGIDILETVKWSQDFDDAPTIPQKPNSSRVIPKPRFR